MKKPQMKDVRGVVERARAGDQIAMAIITEVRDQSKRGNPSAILSKKMMEMYISKNPPGASIGAEKASVNTNPKAWRKLWASISESPDEFALVVVKASPLVQMWQAVVAIVQGPRLSKDNPLMKTAGIKNSRIAAIVRKAYQIQRLQNDRIPISKYCPATAWELGE